MANITIRNLDESLKSRLRTRAASRGRSMEEEARQILRAALNEPAVPGNDLGSRIRQRFEPLGDVQLPLPARAGCCAAGQPISQPVTDSTG